MYVQKTRGVASRSAPQSIDARHRNIETSSSPSSPFCSTIASSAPTTCFASLPKQNSPRNFSRLQEDSVRGIAPPWKPFATRTNQLASEFQP